MEKMHEQLYRLPGGLFLDNAPVYITGGALWQHKQTQELVAQLTLKNIDPRTMQAVTVKLIPFDTVGALLGEGTLRTYEAQILPNDCFGEETTVALPERSCAFGACVSKVCFTDGSSWEPDDLRAWHVAPEDYNPQAPVAKKKGLFGR